MYLKFFNALFLIQNHSKCLRYTKKKAFRHQKRMLQPHNAALDSVSLEPEEPNWLSYPG